MIVKEMRRHAMAMLKDSLRAADPEEAIRRHLRLENAVIKAGKARYRLEEISKIWVVGAGKATSRMAHAVERILGARVAGGVINTKYGHTSKLKRIEQVEAGHPVPDEAGIHGTERIRRTVAAAESDDLVIALISGGASALMPGPAAPVSLEEKQAVTRQMLASGAPIQHINCVRKHISTIKGGQLAREAAPARVLALMLSDVIGDDLDVIGSGPTAPDRSTYGEALRLLEHYGIRGAAPGSVIQRLESGARGELPETVKPGDPLFRRVENIVIGSNRLAVDAAAGKARELGFRTLVLSTYMEGETREVARVHAAIAKEIRHAKRPIRQPACIISGGETTVTLKGEGKGGRNQEFVLSAALDLAGMDRVVVLSAGTDGTDGPTDAAGGIIDGSTIARARAKGLDPRAMLDANDSYNLLAPLGDLIKTGPTGTNVMDVRFVLVA